MTHFVTVSRQSAISPLNSEVMIFSLRNVSMLLNQLSESRQKRFSPQRFSVPEMFSSPRTLIEEDYYQEEVRQAVKRFHIFADAVDNMELGENVYRSECVSSDTVQLILEMNSYELTVDFLKRKLMIADDRLKAVEPDALQKADPAVYELYDKLNSQFTSINQY